MAVDVPSVMDVGGQRSAQLPRSLVLIGDRALAVTAQLENVNVDAEKQQVLDELPARPGMPILRKPMDEQQRFSKEGLMERLRGRTISADDEGPAVRCFHQVLRLAIEGLEVHLVHRRGLGGGLGEQLPIGDGHVGNSKYCVEIALFRNDASGEDAEFRSRAPKVRGPSRERSRPGRASRCTAPGHRATHSPWPLQAPPRRWRRPWYSSTGRAPSRG